MHRESSPAKPLFSSRRERRLWIWTLAVVAGIYATLGLASILAEALYNQGLSAILFLSGMLLVGATVLTQGFKFRPSGLEIGVGLGVAVVYLMAFFRMTIPERSHLFEYGVVAVFVYEALTERASQGRRVPAPALLAIGLTALIGAIDEGIQAFIPSRVFDWVDILFNSMAAVMAILAMVALRWAQRLSTSARRRAEFKPTQDRSDESRIG